MSSQAVRYHGLGGAVRLESGEYHAILDGAFNAGRDAAIAGLPIALKSVPANLRTEWLRGYKSISKGK